MAALFLLRHAKSDWGTGLADHDRPLNARGRKAAAAMGKYLASTGWRPDQVICSTAKRARETLEELMDAASLSVPVDFEPELYLASVETIRSLLKREAGHCGSVLLVGHNPGFHEAALTFSKTGSEDDLRRLHFKYPTGTLCKITFKSDTLGTADFDDGVLEYFVQPRSLA